MGTFADTANVYYRLSFADQGKQTAGFRLQKTKGSLPFPFPVCSTQMEVSVFRTSKYKYIETAPYPIQSAWYV
jgi:hypothetical protein